MRFRKFGGSALRLSLFVCVAGCDLNKTTAQVSAPNAMVATVLATPQVSLTRDAIAGVDAGGFMFDAGSFTIDAGELLGSFDGGTLTIPPSTTVFVFFGKRQGDGLTQAPVGVADAMLKAETPSHSWSLKAQEGGTHLLTTVDDKTLVYEPGVTWTFTATAEAQSYIGDVRDAPAAEHILQLHPDAGFIALAAGSDFILTRPDPPAGSERNLGFVSVVPIDAQGRQGPPTYTNVPNSPLGFLKLVAAPSDWKKTVVTVPGSAFPDRDRNYIIMLQSAKLGGAQSENLFLGSAMIAGSADVGVVKTQ